MELPASEINFWKSYYSLYPFPQERDDQRTALLATVISNMSGLTLKHSIDMNIFMPDYLKESPAPIVEKSIEQQRAEWDDFINRLQVAQESKPHAT